MRNDRHIIDGQRAEIERLKEAGTHWKARAQSSEASLALAVRALEPFARACQLQEEGLSAAISLDDGTILVDDDDFRAARLALIQIKGEGGSSRVTDSGGQEPPSSTPSQDEGG